MCTTEKRDYVSDNFCFRIELSPYSPIRTDSVLTIQHCMTWRSQQDLKPADQLTTLAEGDGGTNDEMVKMDSHDG